MNKLILGVLLMFLSSLESYAQYNHAIFYRGDKLGFSDELIIKYGYIKSMLLFNDTLSFYNHIDGDGAYKSKTFGNKLVHHAAMYNLNKKVYVEMVNFKGKYMISSEHKFDWSLLREVKYVIGYKCFAAISVNTITGDTLKAWYAPELERPFGPSIFRNLPGVILEVQDQRTNFHTIATKIKKTNNNLMFPKNRIISREERMKINNKIK